MLYTPPVEHFGIVPCESMAVGVPVIAVDFAGPRETVKEGVTGFLLKSNPEDWSNKMILLVLLIYLIIR